MAARGMDLEALELVESLCPFPGTIGRICPHPCEQECNRGKDGEPVAICALKRFLDDIADRPYDLFRRELEKNTKSPGKKVAVIGAGPSGLSAALYLRLFGFEVSIFEAQDFGGGTPAIHMPAFRLPADTYQKEVNRILDLGFDLHFGVKLGEDFILGDIQDKDFSAVYLATGAMKPIKLPHTGEEHERFLDGKEFLARVHSGEDIRLDGDVLIIGGGNVAMDVARSAVRCGADNVRIVCLERKPEPGEKKFRYEGNEWREIKPVESVQYMPAHSWEIEEARKEGVEIIDGFATETFDIEDDKVTAVNCLQVERIEQDKYGRIFPILRDGTLTKLKADWVLTAVGSTPDYSFLEEVPEQIPISDGVPLVRLKNGTGLNIPVIAGGDMASGPATVIDAIAAGKEAALYLYSKLMGSAPVSIRYRSRRTLEPWANYPDSPDFRTRRREITLAEEERRASFREVYCGYTAKAAREEAERCMHCDWPLVRESKVSKFFRMMEKDDKEKFAD
jgi:NADPH-dependent glutamate synthase beta subunit-like oxidoreductase